MCADAGLVGRLFEGAFDTGANAGPEAHADASGQDRQQVRVETRVDPGLRRDDVSSDGAPHLASNTVMRGLPNRQSHANMCQPCPRTRAADVPGP